MIETMHLSMTLYANDSAPSEAHAIRDRMVADGERVTANTLHQSAAIGKMLDTWAERTVPTLIKTVAKAGFKPLNTDYEYTVHGDDRGPISFKVWKRFSGS